MGSNSSKPAPRTTDSIIRELEENAIARIEAGEPVDLGAVRQEVIAHQQLARLRARRATLLAAGELVAANDTLTQIQHWLRFVTVDVDEAIAEDPKKNATDLVDPAPADGAAVKG